MSFCVFLNSDRIAEGGAVTYFIPLMPDAQGLCHLQKSFHLCLNKAFPAILSGTEQQLCSHLNKPLF
jgi:hypothetical protein